MTGGKGGGPGRLYRKGVIFVRCYRAHMAKMLAASLLLLAASPLWLSSQAQPSGVAGAPSGEEVLDRLDNNLYFDQAEIESDMIVHGRSGSRTIESRAYKKGIDQALIEYLAPPREKGKKMLKLGDKIWNYIPEPTDRIIAISGHLLRQSVMGSDLSYEDITENHRLSENYEAQVVGSESLEGRDCWVVHLSAAAKDVTYDSRRIWVDKERWLPIREERYARSGKLLKTTRMTEVFRLGEGWYPRHMVFKDELSEGKGTEYIVKSIETDVQIPDHMLTKAALRK